MPLEAFSHSAIATFVIDPEHRVIFWNKASEELTGLTTEKMLGTDKHWQAFYRQKRPCLADLVISAQYDEVADHYQTFRESPLVPDGMQAEGWFEDLGGKKRYVLFDAAPVYDDDGLIVGAIETLQDITEERKQTEAQEQTLLSLQKTLASEKLNGFLPICAHCKSIRDENGEWIPPADYLHEHLGIDFSHGICPQCAPILYPEIFQKK